MKIFFTKHYRETYLNALANYNTSFGFILSQVSQYKSSQCSKYSYQARATFAQYAVQYLVGVFCIILL